ncbi:hypothetical protein SVA_2853 [Sulfurifustis variabilis]|uniref:YncE family protein n=1 Tax=Sulfurifustis variabilis TaxID=1675686 RepID=A0A1B4VCK7_9GAMM|nr:hypothetical protein SVA_2853 [Sulfurifustis variabilis]
MANQTGAVANPARTIRDWIRGPRGPVLQQQAYAYLTDNQGLAVTVIDTGTRTVVRAIEVAGPSGCLTVDAVGERVYVALGTPSQIDVIDAATNVVIDHIPVTARSMAVNPSTARLYGASDGAVVVIDTSTNSVIATLPVGGSLAGVAIKPDGTRVYVADNSGNAVYVIDAAGNTVLPGAIAVGSGPQGLAVHPNGTRLYVANGKDDSVSAIKTDSSPPVVQRISVGSAPYAVAVNKAGTRVYVTNTGGRSVSVIDTARNLVIATVPLGYPPQGVAVSRNGKEVYAVVRGYPRSLTTDTTGALAVIDATCHGHVADVSMGEADFKPGGLGDFLLPH